MFFILKVSIKRKPTAVILFADVLELSILGLVMEVRERTSFRASMTSELSAHAACKLNPSE
jgi:hypothetical protein